MKDVGVGPGWHCLELGAGGGSIAAWLCQQVGPTGRVVASDLDTRFLETVDCPRLEVWRHDLTADDLPERTFDLVHTRALLCHLPEPLRALDQMVGALRPGGWVLVEEPEPTREAIIAPPCAAADLVDRVAAARNRLLNPPGFDPLFVRRIFSQLEARALTEVAAEGRVALTHGGSPLARFYQLTVQQVAPQLVAEGEISAREIDAYAECLANPSNLFMWPMFVATRGRKTQA